MWRELITAVWLTVMSVCDIKRKRVPILLLCAGAVLAGVVLVYRGTGGEADVPGICKALLPGVVFLILAKATEKAGCADGIILIVLGLVEGYQSCLYICLGGLISAALISGTLLMLRKVKRNTKIPFVPFLAAGWVIALCERRGVW